MNVLCLAPHPDDEVLGCGGALCLHADKGDHTSVVFLTSGELGFKHLPSEEARRTREAEASAAAKILGLKDLVFFRFPDSSLSEHIDAAARRLTSSIESLKPDLIYLPHPQEWHPDHKAAVLIAQALGRSIELRAYEVWTPIQEHDHVLDITPVWNRKISALRAHASQLAQWPYERAIQGLNQYRGAMAGRCSYAEVFKSV
jgi:LmbE family N-acetylglucosaminyl deacetylase